MPYVQKAVRDQLDMGYRPKSPGDLNYLITQLCIEYLGQAPKYQQYNDVVGALEACKLEFYRRAVSPYEDRKIQENGDVY